MQTFMPYVTFATSANCLDNKRLNKQITECRQIMRALARKRLGMKAGWQSHPAVLMWEGHLGSLQAYHNCCVRAWWDRGYNSHTMLAIHGLHDDDLPSWVGDLRLHVSHQANLVRKDPDHYGPLFPYVDPSLPYYWPTQGEAK
jgi:hypothetical protein